MTRITQAVRIVLAALLLAVPASAFAQANTAETLDEAARLYDDLQVERAVVLLRRVLSTSSPFEVQPEQRVQAYVYLGASLAILGQRDSAVTYFRAALERDPFADLDPARFTARERAAFADARQRTLAVGARQIMPRRFDPRTDQIAVVFVSTQTAMVRVEVRSLIDTTGTVLFEHESEGVREVPWTGMFGGAPAPEGRYALIVRARNAAGATDSSSLAFTVAHDHEALEDTLPDLHESDLVPERWPASMANRDLGRGIVLAAAALTIPSLGNRDLGEGGRPFAQIAAAGALSGGIAAFVERRRHPVNMAAIATNNSRRVERAAHNAEVARRNAGRLAAMRIVIIPELVTR
jgi:tetratricopeptide (TPR) repeat protein